jgi:hypothetical protein
MDILEKTYQQRLQQFSLYPQVLLNLFGNNGFNDSLAYRCHLLCEGLIGLFSCCDPLFQLIS